MFFVFWYSEVDNTSPSAEDEVKVEVEGEKESEIEGRKFAKI